MAISSFSLSRRALRTYALRAFAIGGMALTLLAIHRRQSVAAGADGRDIPDQPPRDLNFVYQGYVEQNGVPLSGNVDFRVRVSPGDSIVGNCTDTSFVAYSNTEVVAGNFALKVNWTAPADSPYLEVCIEGAYLGAVEILPEALSSRATNGAFGVDDLVSEQTLTLSGKQGIYLDANGTGDGTEHIQLEGDTTTAGDATVTGNISVTGALRVSAANDAATETEMALDHKCRSEEAYTTGWNPNVLQELGSNCLASQSPRVAEGTDTLAPLQIMTIRGVLGEGVPLTNFKPNRWNCFVGGFMWGTGIVGGNSGRDIGRALVYQDDGNWYVTVDFKTQQDRHEKHEVVVICADRRISTLLSAPGALTTNEINPGEFDVTSH